MTSVCREPGCPHLTPCPTHSGHTGWSPSRSRAGQASFRAALIRRSGGACEYPGCDTPYDRPQAHHDRPGYTPDCGRLLCAQHHQAVDPHAR